jgi:hypothetical protein
MLARIYAAFAALFVLTASAHGAGTIPGISMTQQLDELAKPLSGGLLYFIQAGTTATPQNCYQDTALTLVWPNPITLDAAGRVPQIFCADGTIKIRLTDKNGVQKLVQDNLLVIGASSGGGGGGTVDPTTILTTGDVKFAYGTGIVTGFVRMNGRTIGSATSGATERANADTSALFVYLWGVDANLAVSGGRGASAAADYAANKTLTLPDARGRGIFGIDDMGNTAAGRLTASFFTSPTTLGASGGTQSRSLVTGNLPPYTPSGSVSVSGGTAGMVNSGISYQSGASPIFVAQPNGSTNNLGAFGAPLSGMSGSFTGTAQGGTSSAFGILPPMLLTTFYLKL